MSKVGLGKALAPSDWLYSLWGIPVLRLGGGWFVSALLFVKHSASKPGSQSQLGKLSIKDSSLSLFEGVIGVPSFQLWIL